MTDLEARRQLLYTAINHEADPHCCGCYNVGRDLIAECNECGHMVDLAAALRACAAPPPDTLDPQDKNLTVGRDPHADASSECVRVSTDGSSVHRRVVCAANRAGSTLVLGPRHWHMLMHDAAEHALGTSYFDHEWEQGFIDQHGDWMDRREAWKVAAAAGQIIHRCGGDTTDGGTLYSENLY